MSISAKLIERSEQESAFAPKDITGAGVDGDWVRVEKRILILLASGAWAGGTSAVTVEQATDNAGTGAKAVAFDRYWTKTSGTSTGKWAEQVATSNTFNVAAANKLHAIEVDGAELDVDGGFCYVRVRAATPGANADLLAGTYLFEGRELGDPAGHPDPKA